MKKTYVKPQAFFESFELSACVAGSCAVNLHFGEKNCFYEVPTTGDKFFLPESLCTSTPQNGELGDVCYHGHLNEVFSS